MTDAVTSALGVHIKTGDAARELLALKQGLEGAATGIARLGREIQNHSGNIQRVLGELSKHGFGGLSAGVNREVTQVGASMRQLEREVIASATKAGRGAGKALSEGIHEGATKVSDKTKNIVTYFELVSRSARASTSHVRSSIEALTTLQSSQHGAHQDLLGMYRRMTSAINYAEAAERNFIATTATRVQTAVAGLTAENAELVKMRAHYSALQRDSAMALARSFETKGASAALIRSQVGGLSVMPAREAGLATYYAELERIGRITDRIRASEEAWAASSSSRVQSAVAGLTSENSELAKMRAHYSALQRDSAKARAGSFGRYGLNMNKGNLQAAISTRTGAGLDASAMTLQYRDGVSAFGAVERAAIASTPAINASRQAMKRWSDETKVAHDMARGAAAGVGYLWMTWGNIGAMAAGFTAVRGMSAAIKESAEVEVLLTKASREAGVSYDSMRTKMMALYTDGVTPMMTGPKEVAQQLKDLVYAGFEAGEAFDMLTVSLKFAEVGELEAGEAAQVLQQTIHAFGLTGKDSARVADVLAKAAAASATDVGAMASAMRQAVTVGALYNASVEDTATSLAVLAKAGIEGSAAGTALKRFMDELASPKTNKAKEAIKALGVDVFQMVNGVRQLKPLSGIVDEMRSKFQGLSKTDAKSFFDLVDRMQDERGKKFFSLAVKMDQTEWDEFKKTIETDSAGFVDSLYGALSQTTQGLFKQVAAQLRASMQEALQELDQPLKDLGQQLLTLVTSTGFKEFLKDAITLLATLTRFMIEHGREVLAVVAAYKSFQIARGILFSVSTGVAALGAAWSRTGRVVGVVTAGKGALLLRMASLGRTIPYIGGLLAAGAALWSIWGNSAKAATDQAAAAMESTAERAKEVLDRIRREAKYGTGDIATLREYYQQLRRERTDLEGKLADAHSRKDMGAVIQYQADLEAKNREIRDLRPDMQALAERERKANEVLTGVTIPDLEDGNGSEALRIAKEALEGKVNLAKQAGQALMDDLKHQQAMQLVSEVEYTDRSFEIQRDALLKEYLLYVDHYNAMLRLGKQAEAQDALNKVNATASAMGKNGRDNVQAHDLINKREQDAIDAQLREYAREDRSVDFDRSMRGVDSWLQPFYAKQESMINALHAKLAEAKRSGKEFSAQAQEAMWENLRTSLEGMWSRSNEMSPERLRAMLSEFNDRKAAKAQELEAGVSIGALSQTAARGQMNRFIVDAGKDLETLAGTNLDELIASLGLSAVEAEKLKSEVAQALAEIDKAGKTRWFDGLAAGFRKYADDVGTLYDGMEQAATRAFKGMEDALVQYVMTGKTDFRSLANSIIADLLRITIQQAAMKPLANAMSAGVSAAGSWAMNLLFAQGGAFTGSTGLSAYTNQIVTRPTMFAFAHGIGLMGEEPGAPGEAIMPLTRMSGGDLGVKVSSDGGGAASVSVSVTYNDNRTASEKTTQQGDSRNAAKLTQLIKDQVQTVIVQEMRPGGLLA